MSEKKLLTNGNAFKMIKELRKEYYFGEDTPLVCDENGNYTRPVNFRKRFYRILKGAGIETKGLHALRHTFATKLVNGIKQPDGSIKSLTPRQVADLLGHSTSEITERYYVKKDTTYLNGITDEFEMWLNKTNFNNYLFFFNSSIFLSIIIGYWMFSLLKNSK